VIDQRLAEVEDIIKSHATRGVRMYPRAGFDDLVQEGRIAAWKAFPKWDPQGGKSWRTYAGWAIRLQIMKAAWNQGNAVAPRFSVVMKTLQHTGEGTPPPEMGSIDDPAARALRAESPDGATPSQRWALVAALRRTKATDALAFLLYHRCGQTIYQIADEMGCSHESARQYEKAARRDVEAAAARLEWRARPGTCPGWGSGKHAHLAPIPSLGLCPNCWAAINHAAAVRGRRSAA
jgi:RNA polymerase sigma factor (sigma-70 family)